MKLFEITDRFARRVALRDKVVALVMQSWEHELPRGTTYADLTDDDLDLFDEMVDDVIDIVHKHNCTPEKALQICHDLTDESLSRIYGRDLTAGKKRNSN